MDDERPRKKACVGAAGAAGPGVSAKVLNQGGHGTCVGYAFSLVMTTGLHEKYEIACDAEKFVEKVKALCPCWEGHETELMLGEWNDQHAKPGAAIEDVDQRRRYNVKVEYTKVTSFEEARAEMERQKTLWLLMPCTISTETKGHELHAVALRGTAPGGKMEAVNSWGANQSLLEVTPANFRYAIRFDPVITAAARSGGVQIVIPPVRRIFAARVQEQGSELQDDKRKKAEQAKRKQAEQDKRAKRKRIAKVTEPYAYAKLATRGDVLAPFYITDQHVKAKDASGVPTKIEIVLGRSPPAAVPGQQVQGSNDVDYHIGASMRISRKHARIYWSHERQSFCIQSICKNAVKVNQQTFPGSPDGSAGTEAVLGSQACIEIADSPKIFFLLPAKNSQSSHGRLSVLE